MAKFACDYSATYGIELDETKFTEEFMAEFREGFYPFFLLSQHAEHIAQLYARGLYDPFFDEFIEGYGKPSEMGIKVVFIGATTESQLVLENNNA